MRAMPGRRSQLWKEQSDSVSKPTDQPRRESKSNLSVDVTVLQRPESSCEASSLSGL